MNLGNELLDSAGQNDSKIGTIRRGQKPAELNIGHEILRAPEILILNKNGGLWIPRRNSNKSMAAGNFEYS